MTPQATHHFRNPWWPLITTTIPVAILCYIFREAVELVTDQLSVAQVSGWKFVGAACALLWVLHTGYTALHQFRRRPLDRRYGLITVATYAIFLMLCCCGSSERIPEDIQGSILGENRLFYAALCLSPTFAHSAMILLLCPPRKSLRVHHRRWIACGFVALLAILIIFSGPHAAWGYATDTGLILAFIALHYHVVRWTLLLTKKPQGRQGITFAFKLAAVVAYPLSGVLVNTDILFDIVFRTFAYPGFYLFTLFNGVVVFLGEPRQPHWRMFLFMLRMITFGFILMMQVLYLPLLPQSAMALAGFGLGYLMLAPILLTIIKTKLIVTDLSFLKRHFSKKTVAVLSLCAACACFAFSMSLFQFEDETRAFASAILHALAFLS